MFCLWVLKPNKLSTLSIVPKHCMEIFHVTNWHPPNLQMNNLCIDEMVLFCNLKKIGTVENKAMLVVPQI